MRAIVADVPLAGLSFIDWATLYSQDQFPVTIGGRHEPSKGIHDRDHRQATGRQHCGADTCHSRSRRGD